MNRLSNRQEPIEDEDDHSQQLVEHVYNSRQETGTIQATCTTYATRRQKTEEVQRQWTNEVVLVVEHINNSINLHTKQYFLYII